MLRAGGWAVPIRCEDAKPWLRWLEGPADFLGLELPSALDQRGNCKAWTPLGLAAILATAGLLALAVLWTALKAVVR